MKLLQAFKRMIGIEVVKDASKGLDRWIRKESDVFLMVLYILIVLALQGMIIFLAVSEGW